MGLGELGKAAQLLTQAKVAAPSPEVREELESLLVSLAQERGLLAADPDAADEVPPRTLAKELRKDAPANDDDAEGAFPADPEFISLDDIPEAKDEAINMKEGGSGLEDDELGGPLVW